MRAWTATIALGTWLAGCGGATRPVPATDGGLLDAPVTTGCPGAAPDPGERCSVDGLGCSFGDAPLAECRDAWRCADGRWQRTTEWGICPADDAGACPSEPPDAGDAGPPICAADGLKCAFADGTICRCTACSYGPCAPPPPHWACAPKPLDPACPGSIPNDGSRCEAAGKSCFYGGAAFCGLTAACDGGRWRWSPQPCPAVAESPLPRGASRPGAGP